MRTTLPFLFAAAVLFAGCSSTQTISVHVTDPRPAVDVQAVTLMQSVPMNAVLLAELTASSCSTPSATQAAQADLKKAAAHVGANVLVIQQWNRFDYFYGFEDKFSIQGYAYFVPPVPMDNTNK